jgi:hypothetical protein
MRAVGTLFPPTGTSGGTRYKVPGTNEQMDRAAERGAEAFSAPPGGGGSESFIILVFQHFKFQALHLVKLTADGRRTIHSSGRGSCSRPLISFTAYSWVVGGVSPRRRPILGLKQLSLSGLRIKGITFCASHLFVITKPGGQPLKADHAQPRLLAGSMSIVVTAKSFPLFPRNVTKSFQSHRESRLLGEGQNYQAHSWTAFTSPNLSLVPLV